MKQLNLYALVNQTVPCPISFARILARKLRHTPADIPDFTPSISASTFSTETICGETLQRFAKLAQTARLAYGLEDSVLLPTHIFEQTDAKSRASLRTLDVRFGLGISSGLTLDRQTVEETKVSAWLNN